MEILVWKTLETVRDRLSKLAAGARRFKSNRRAGKGDRRRSVNDGLIVTLSTRKERRQNRDRRQNNTDWNGFTI